MHDEIRHDVLFRSHTHTRTQVHTHQFAHTQDLYDDIREDVLSRLARKRRRREASQAISQNMSAKKVFFNFVLFCAFCFGFVSFC